MTGPLYPQGAFGMETGFVLIFFVGLAFGFFLERAGFGSARKLAGIFYFRDFAVLRVMFTAIIVAMLGLIYFSSMGWIDMQGVSVPATFLWAQIAGGLLLGIGFVVGGYCPGTSVVAAASGKLDALPYIAGLLAGNMIFGFGYDWLKPLYLAGAQGVRTVPEWLGWDAGTVAAVVAVIALAAFAATEYAERGKTPGREITITLTWNRAGAAALGMLVFVLLIARAIAGANAAPVVAQAAEAPKTRAVSPVPAKMAPAQQQAPLAAPPGGVKKFKKAASCS